MKYLLFIGVLSGVLSGALAAQDNAGLKARELFYTPPPAATPPAAATKAAPIKAATKAPPAKTPAAKQAVKTPVSAGTPAAHTVAAVPLGVRYSVLKRNAANQFVEVDADTTFHSGDRIRLQVQANTKGYLYVVTQGSSGVWQVLFPSAEVAGGSNLLEPGDTRQVPPGDRGQFVFDDRGGTEKLFLVLARQGEPDLDKLIYSMGGATAPDGTRTLLAKSAVTDDVVARMRAQVSSRDLVFEKVDGEVDGKPENAAYVVNPSSAPDARLVVDLSLNHK